jgi:phage shock protein C
MIAGVCGGLGAYLGVDPTWVRLFFVFLALFTNGVGLLLYIVLAIIVPEGETAPADSSQPAQAESGDLAQQMTRMGETLSRSLGAGTASPHGTLLIGLVLILLGLGFLARNLGLLSWLRGDLIWPVVLIAVGLVLLMRDMRK